MYPAILAALPIWNACTFLLFGLDKRRAVRGGRRIREKTLLGCALLLGGPGALAGMGVFRHKTRRLRFRLLIPLAAACQLALLLYLYCK